MSNSKEKTQEAARIEVGNLPEQEKQLNDQEAEKVKGGAGRPGGVIAYHIGEEIPQTTGSSQTP
jgi:hypothetical protein